MPGAIQITGGLPGEGPGRQGVEELDLGAEVVVRLCVEALHHEASPGGSQDRGRAGEFTLPAARDPR